MVISLKYSVDPWSQNSLVALSEIHKTSCKDTLQNFFGLEPIFFKTFEGTTHKIDHKFV